MSRYKLDSILVYILRLVSRCLFELWDMVDCDRISCNFTLFKAGRGHHSDPVQS